MKVVEILLTNGHGIRLMGENPRVKRTFWGKLKISGLSDPTDYLQYLDLSKVDAILMYDSNEKPVQEVPHGA